MALLLLLLRWSMTTMSPEPSFGAARLPKPLQPLHCRAYRDRELRGRLMIRCAANFERRNNAPSRVA
jgi:hypothetical protein